jgi:hypothetical protein
MKINKLKKSALKNDKIFLGSYHKKNKNQGLFFISFLLYHAKAIKLKSDKALKFITTEPSVSALKTRYPTYQSHNFL